MTGLRKDCVYYEPMLPANWRGYCNKLQKVIKARDCRDCGWYYLKRDAGTMGEVGRKDLTKLLEEDKKKWGV